MPACLEKKKGALDGLPLISILVELEREPQAELELPHGSPILKPCDLANVICCGRRTIDAVIALCSVKP